MKNRWIFRLYNLFVLLALPFIVAGVVLRWRKRFSKGMERWDERRGRLRPETLALLRQPAPKGGWWWIHAVSLGEVKAIEGFLKQIAPQAGAKVLLSVVTPEALSWSIEKRLADAIIAAPIDLPWMVRRVARAVKPRLFLSVESEFWPNLLREAKRAGARVALVNGRISEHSYGHYKYIQSLMTCLWECFDLLAVRGQEDANRFADLGVPSKLLRVTGNLKYDVPLPNVSKESSAKESGRLTIVVGSSRKGEEKEILPAIQALSKRFTGLRVIWVPRHIERVNEIESLFAAHALSWTRKSSSASSESPFLLWDSMGDLVDAYKQADIAIVGGSFVQKGGQNPLEPAALSVPVVFGPSMENFRGIAEVLVQQGGAKQVELRDLERCLSDLIGNEAQRKDMGVRAREAVESRQGATDKTLKLLNELLRA